MKVTLTITDHQGRELARYSADLFVNPGGANTAFVRVDPRCCGHLSDDGWLAIRDLKAEVRIQG